MLTVIGIVINSTSLRSVPATRSPARSPARRLSSPVGTYTAQGWRVPPSAAGSQLQIKLPPVGAGRRGQRTRARRRFPRDARMSAATRPHALARRDPRTPSLADRRQPPCTASRGARSPGWRTPGRRRLRRGARRAPSSAPPPPASLPPSAPLCCCCCGRQM